MDLERLTPKQRELKKARTLIDQLEKKRTNLLKTINDLPVGHAERSALRSTLNVTTTEIVTQKQIIRNLQNGQPFLGTIVTTSWDDPGRLNHEMNY